MSNECAKILTDEGVSKDDATEILDRLKNNEKPEIILKDKEYDQFRQDSNERSKTKTNEYVNTIKDVASSLKRPYKTLFNMLVNGKTSIANMSRTRVKQRMNEILAETQMGDLEMAYMLSTNQKFKSALIEELFNFDGKQKTKDITAFNLAKAIHRHQTKQIEEANKHGAGLIQLDDYVTKQWHDIVKITEAGAVKWADDIMKELNVDETIRRILRENKTLKKEDFNIREYLENIFGEMTRASSNNGIVLDAMRLRRVLAFKDGESLIRYNTKYGHQNIAQAIFENMEMMDNHITLGEIMGFGFDDVKTVMIKGKPQQVTDKISPVDETKNTLLALKDMGKLSENEYSRLSAGLREISGDNYVVGNPNLAKLHSAYVGWKIMTTLGKAVLSSIMDISSAGIFLHYNGISPTKGYYGLLKHTFRAMTRQISKEEKLNIFRMLKVGADGAIHSNYSRYTTGDLVSGKIAEGANMMFHLNFLNMWTNMMREGYSSMTSMHLANNLNKSFDEIPELLQRTLSEYGIRKGEWKELQKVGSFNAGRYKKGAHASENYLTSDWITENGGSQVLADKLDHYFINESRLAIPEADASDRAIMFGNHDRGTVPDIARRLFFFLRTHQVNQARNLYPRMFQMGLPSIVHTIPAIGLGYTSIALKSMASGKEPPDIKDPALILDALMQSGYAPIIGDFIAGEYGRYRHSLDEAILGAGYTDIKNWTQLFAGLLTGEKKASELYNNLRYNVPYANLFYTESAVNYGIHYGIMESFNPGYLDRIEARARGMGTEFMYEPSNIWGY